MLQTGVYHSSCEASYITHLGQRPFDALHGTDALKLSCKPTFIKIV